MRSPMIVAVPLLAALAVAPASAQLSGRAHVQIPIGRQGQVRRGAERQLTVHQYDARRYGAWESYYDQWVPETVYYYDGDYYDYPIVAYAEPIVVYRYLDELFLAPPARQFTIWRDQYRAAPVRRDIGRDVGRDVGRDYRPAPRATRSYPSAGDRGQVRPQQVAPRSQSRPVAPQPRQGGQDRGRVQAPQQTHGGRAAPAPRGGGRSRSRP